MGELRTNSPYRHTQLRVTFNLDDNDDTGNDYLGYYSGENGTAANRPQLVVIYQ